MSLHLPLGTLTGKDPGDLVDLTPDRAGWEWCGVRVIRLEPGVPRTVLTGGSEVFVLPLAGGLEAEVHPIAGDGHDADGGHDAGDGHDVAEPEAVFALQGRTSVFTQVTDFAYAGRDSRLVLRSRRGAEVALPAARCDRRLPPAYGPASGVPVEVRGSGAASRQVTNFGAPGAWDHAVKLVACELITPPGNWSSYPPHKHDATRPCPVVNEEIYLYRIGGPDQVTPSREGFGLHRTYTGPEHAGAGLVAIDLTAEVRDLDVVLVPHGYHGPCVAAPGYPMYYLNVLAGPGADRSMAFCDDPAHAWLRGTWPVLTPDPRVPATSAAGRVTPSDRSAEERPL